MAPWKDVLFSGRDSVMLVEGETDSEYFKLLQDEAHGEDRLKFDGIIFAYGGKDTLKQKQLLRFVMSQFKRFILTYDLDAEHELVTTFRHLGLVNGKDYIAIGKKEVGKQSIEGLLPDEVFSAVFSENVELVQKATLGTGADAKDAKNALKSLYLTKFKAVAKPQTTAYSKLYGLVRVLNKMYIGDIKSDAAKKSE